MPPVHDQGTDVTGCMHCLMTVSGSSSKCIKCPIGPKTMCYHSECGQLPPVKHEVVLTSKCVSFGKSKKMLTHDRAKTDEGIKRVVTTVALGYWPRLGADWMLLLR